MFFKVGDTVLYKPTYRAGVAFGVVKSIGKMYASIGYDTRIHLPSVLGVVREGIDPRDAVGQLQALANEKLRDDQARAARYVRARAEAMDYLCGTGKHRYA